MIKTEAEKMIKVGVNFLIKHSSWLANIVPVRKRNGKILIFIDFCNLNRVSMNDNYLVPLMDKILQTVNRVSIDEKDQTKTTFTTL